MTGGRDSSRPWKFSKIFGIPFAFALLLALIVASPLLLEVIGDRHTDWALLANIGQAYGGPAAILSGIALIGIAASLILQWRQHRLDMFFVLRQRHFEMMQLALDLSSDDPQSSSSINTVLNPKPVPTLANLWVAHWAMYWDLRAISEETLRRHSSRLFSDSRAREWWSSLDSGWSSMESPRRRKFERILTEECARATSQTLTPAVPSLPAGEKAIPMRSRPTTQAATALLTLAVGIGLVLRRIRRKA